MREAEERMIFQNAVDRRLSGLQENPFLAHRIMNAEKGEIKPMKKKLTLSMVLVIVLLLIAVAALAVALLSPKDIVEQVAVPVAQNNDQENYTYEELADLIRTLNENGITLDEGSKMMKAFQARHGYWEADTIKEICLAAFGDDSWTPEQRYWYGEMMVAIGAWNHNAYFLPKEDELQEKEARILAVQVLKNTYNVDLPSESNDSWTVTSALGEESETGIPSWFVTFIPNSDDYELHGYTITFDLHGENAQPDRLVKINEEMDESTVEKYKEIQANFEKEKQVTSEYGEVMHFWPDEVKVEVYGGLYGLPYAIPDQDEYAVALEDAKRFITEKYGADALDKLGDYKVGYLFQKLDDEEDVETKATQLMWDIMFTTDPEFLSDGYRVQFQRVIEHETGEEKIYDVIVEHANLGSG